MTQTNPKRALVLSGGGGRGAYHVGALRFLEEHEWVPEIIVGTSIGAVNGAAIASGHNAHSLWALWRRLTTGDVQELDVHFSDLFSLMQRDHLFDTAPLRKTLVEEGWIDLSRINTVPPSKHLRITAVEISSGRLRVFGNSADPSTGSRTEYVHITLDHVLASCSIPMIYPPTKIGKATFWDGGTVSNTPLGPAIDAGADDIVVVLMTPWDTDRSRPCYLDVREVENLESAVQATLEWALLASFQVDMRLFERSNRLAELRKENARLREEIVALKAQLQPESAVEQPPSAQQTTAPKRQFREIQSPIIVSPECPIPAVDIIRYNLDNHEKLYEMGYADARAAWMQAGRPVEG